MSSSAAAAVLNPIRTMQLLLGRPGGIRLWRLLMILRFRSRDAATALLRPLCRCPEHAGPLGCGPPQEGHCINAGRHPPAAVSGA